MQFKRTRYDVHWERAIPSRQIADWQFLLLILRHLFDPFAPALISKHLKIVECIRD
jgi:hypothetical protein